MHQIYLHNYYKINKDKKCLHLVYIYISLKINYNIKIGDEFDEEDPEGDKILTLEDFRKKALEKLDVKFY